MEVGVGEVVEVFVELGMFCLLMVVLKLKGRLKGALDLKRDVEFCYYPIPNLQTGGYSYV